MRAYSLGRNRLSYWQLPPHIERSLSSTPPGLLPVCRVPEKEDVGKRCTNSHVLSVHSRLEILPAVCMLRWARAAGCHKWSTHMYMHTTHTYTLRWGRGAGCGVGVGHSYVVNTHAHAHNTHTRTCTKHTHTHAYTCKHLHTRTHTY